MAHYKISEIKRFNCIKVFDKKKIEVNDLRSGQYSVNKNERFKPSILRYHLCDYTDIYCCERNNKCYRQ